MELQFPDPRRGGYIRSGLPGLALEKGSEPVADLSGGDRHNPKAAALGGRR